MRIQVNQNTLANHINIVQKGISSRTTMQILDGILLNTINGKLKLTATDLEIRIESNIECNIMEEGAIVVNSRIFGDIIKKLPNSTINITVKDNNINIVCENSEFNILGSPAYEYPELPAIINQSSFNIPKDLLKSAIKQTVFATTQDETRPILTGVLLEISEGIASFVALDGYRLALRSIPINDNINTKIVIPGRVLNELNKILDDEDELTITTAPGHIIFNMGDTIVSSRLLEGQFLNYRDIIRKDHKTSIVVNRKELQDSLERASLLAKEEKANLVKLNIVDNKVIIKSNSEIGNVHEEINSVQNGDNINIAFNSKYIIDGIKAIDSEEIELHFVDRLNPCIMNPVGDENYIYLVLPVRLAQDDY
ncbi:DNA polymerase III subunit beta [Tepidimicrobium xylanilyticum]|uniref:Beta sliding clamp n=1 Tax=Tepidimicrobium xylanilyticum TaxID=1123352 RepID=A0A1H3AI55_9FIRM|nr:DNA polymerase III subunit beta [Tepidimicrobium xylanilyticum]GMG98144.1 DNA polymerase III subunit beta [Tepidimicrobium xylanilyticum]SDX29303.1 DNA polymerase III, beta subunit [Tepidimicrobium xylanilyticum]